MVQPRLLSMNPPQEVTLSFALSVAALTIVYVVVGTLERRPALQFRPLSAPRPYLATDAAWYAFAIGATAISVFVLQPILARGAIGPIADRVSQLPLPARLLASLVVFDGISFGVHLLLHRSDTLWNIHKVHHSTLELDGFATTRTHMLENMARFLPGQLVLFLIGMPVTVVAPTVALAAIYGVSNHSNLNPKVPWIEALLVTPRLHRRHHVPSTTQTNFGAIFTFWDRALGTLVRRDTATDERYGVPGEIDTYPQQFGKAVRQPLRQIRQHHSGRGRPAVSA